MRGQHLDDALNLKGTAGGPDDELRSVVGNVHLIRGGDLFKDSVTMDQFVKRPSRGVLE